MSAKRKIVNCRGAFNINRATFVYIDVCPPRDRLPLLTMVFQNLMCTFHLTKVTNLCLVFPV